MKKHLNSALSSTTLALDKLTEDLYHNYYQALLSSPVADYLTPNQIQLRDLAQTAEAMHNVLKNVWQLDRTQLAKHIANPNFEAIHPLLQEVLLVKEQARARHQARKAEEERAAFALRARVRFTS